MNETTLLVIQLAGPIFVAVGVGFLLNAKYFLGAYKDFENSPMLVITLGMVTMLMGLLIVLNHNLWSSAPEVIVSLLGFGAIIKGVAFFLAPTYVAKLAMSLMHKTLMMVSGAGIVILGGYLSLVAYF